MKTLKDIETSGSKSVTTKREMKWNSDGAVLPAGTSLTIYFRKGNYQRIYFELNGSLRASLIQNAHRNFTGFSKPPGLKTLERYSYDGVAKTVTGHRTEPDGYGPDGSPSWLLVLGYI